MLMPMRLASAPTSAEFGKTARDCKIGLDSGTKCLRMACLCITIAGAPIFQSYSSTDTLSQ